MKVKELIKLLKQLDPESTVKCFCPIQKIYLPVTLGVVDMGLVELDASWETDEEPKP